MAHPIGIAPVTERRWHPCDSALLLQPLCGNSVGQGRCPGCDQLASTAPTSSEYRRKAIFITFGNAARAATIGSSSEIRSDHTRACARVFAKSKSQPPRFERRRSNDVLVRDNNVYQALRALKKKLQHEGVFRDYEKPSVKATREKRDEAARRALKLVREQHGMG